MNKTRFLKLLIILSLMGSPFLSMAQNSSIGFHTTVTEYDGDINGNKHQFYNFAFNKFGAGLSLQQYLNRSFNLAEMLTYNRLAYRNSDQTQGVDANFTSANLNLRYKINNGYLLSEASVIAPYFTIGLGATYINSNKFGTSNAPISDGVFKANLNAGAGVLFRFNDQFGLEFSNTLQMPTYDAWDGVNQGDNDIYLQHSLGLIIGLKKPVDTDKDGVADKRDDCPETPTGVTVDSKGCPMDRDADGVPDFLDKCPEMAGDTQQSGCPDRDKDGVADGDDKCPDTSGLARFSGCPDTDGDGIQDSEDLCPNVKGSDQFKGCPDTDGDGIQDSLDKCPNSEANTKVNAEGCPADTDGDGIVDLDDACPNLAGVVANNGCPEIKAEVKQLFQKALQGIEFETGKAVIKKTSFPILDAITKVMVENPSYKLYIGGHTDSIGEDAMNMTLSQNRADAVANYLITHGVDPLRTSAKGYGESTPVDSNLTAAGRTRNRRVEFRVDFLK